MLPLNAQIRKVRRSSPRSTEARSLCQKLLPFAGPLASNAEEIDRL